MRIRTLVVALSISAAAGAGLAQPAVSLGPPPGRGYLTNEQMPASIAVLPPAPKAGSDRYETDRHVFLATRALEGTPRWALAQADNDYSAPHLLDVFNCGVGAKMTPQNAPVTLRILTNMLSDADKASRSAKALYQRQRPYLIDEGNICIPKTADLAASYDYPSGHTTLGWSAGLILAELVPDHAEAILMRARSYGESRVVCGVHNSSAIEGGRTAGALVVAAMHGSPAFQADMQAAKAEIAGIRANAANAVDAQTCQTEHDLIEKTPYPQ